MDGSETTEIIEKKACVQAKIRVIPEAGVGAVLLEYVGEPRREPCEEAVYSQCDFVISQMICVKIPVRFTADAEVVAVGIACEEAREEACEEACEKASPDREPDICDATWGYRHYKDNRHPAKNTDRSFARNYRLTHRNNPEFT